uniref:Calponin-homology (CH) domain-containing protein n=1 Tax=Heligmosomoides polygyrus TaxID=6339 RepID=A0A183GR30_HELPZ
LGVLDTAWLIREYGLNKRGPLEIIAERESIYRLLAQVTKDNMNKAINKYTIDPKTRYVSLESSLQPEDVVQIVSSDNPRLAPIGQPLIMNNSRSVHTNPDLKKYSTWKFCYQALLPYKLKMSDMDLCWNDGRALAGLLAKFRPEILDYFSVISMDAIEDRIKVVLSAVEQYMGISAPCAASEWVGIGAAVKSSYIGALVDAIRVRNQPAGKPKCKTLEDDSLHYTKRPQVDRLDPELVQKVEKMVTGDLLKEQALHLQNEKDRQVPRVAQKIIKNDVIEMEKRLENSGMGVLYNKKEQRSSQDEKVQWFRGP